MATVQHKGRFDQLKVLARLPQYANVNCGFRQYPSDWVQREIGFSLHYTPNVSGEELENCQNLLLSLPIDGISHSFIVELLFEAASKSQQT